MNHIDIEVLKVNPTFDTLLHHLHPTELEHLRISLASDGWRDSDPVKIWGETIVDGHNRYRIAKELGITSIPAAAMYFNSEDECLSFMLRNQIGRRNTPEQLRSLYVGQLFDLLRKDIGSTAAVEQIAEQENVSPRQVYRDAKLNEAFKLADEMLQNEFLAGEVSAKALVEALQVTAPPPMTREELAEQARIAFPQTVHAVAARVKTGIQNLRALCADVELVFRNGEVDIEEFAPEIAAMFAKLADEELEAERLGRLAYADGKYRIGADLGRKT